MESTALAFMIERCASAGNPGWLELRRELWPHCEEADHLAEMTATCSNPDRLSAFLAKDEAQRPVGFVEAALRTDYVNGTHSSPVGFVEGIYVIPSARRRGFARALVRAAEAWARTNGCREMASDARIENESSQAMHRALGFAETMRVVYFRKELAAEVRADAHAPNASPADIANRLLGAWNARDLDRFVGLLSEDVEWHDPAMAQPPVRGRAAVREFAQAVLEAFPDFHYEVDSPICSAADGSRCAIVWRISATHRHPLRPLGYAPTGRRATFDGVDVLDIRNGEITRIRTAFDPVVAAEQLLGMRLRPVPGTRRATLAVVVERFLAWMARRRNRRGP